MKLGSKFVKRIAVSIAIVAVLSFISVRIYYELTADFHLGNITYEIPYDPNWEVPSLSSQEELALEKILDQPFKYLGKGSQCYAFESADGNYVLKFFKFKHLRPSRFVNALPSIGPIKTYQEKQAARKQRKLYGVYNSHRLAYSVDKEESGLLFIQLNYFGNKSRTVVLYDKLGLQQIINLEHIAFIVQKKGEVFRDLLTRLLKDGNIALAETRIAQIFDMYAGEYQKGIYDHDHGVMRNIGFIGNQPIHLDVGKLMTNQSMRNSLEARQDINLVSDKIKQWIRHNYPEYSARLNASMDEKIHLLFDNHQ